jgi:two-component system cell cycle response regulator
MTEPTPAAERRYSILVIDDEPPTAELLRVACKNKPYDILEVNCGEAGLMAAAAEYPDLILLDLMMPDIDGITVAQSLKNDPRCRNIPIILLTSVKDTDAKVQAFAAGADDFINKSFKWEEIEARIASMLRKRDFLLSLESEVKNLTATNKHLEELMVLDAKTGLHNFGEFQRRLRAEWNRAERYKIPLSLILFDLDKFKEVNDTRGHQAGDRTLQQFSTLVTGGARANDVAARYGGEEFAMILPHTDGEMALRVAERIRRAVSEFLFLEESSPLHITVSGGVATYHSSPDIESVDALVGAADRALYQAKERGRNCIVQHQPV